MTQVEARDLVLAYITQFGVGSTERMPRAIIDHNLNVVCQQHFEYTKSLKSYWHTLVNKNLNEYARPSGMLVESLVKINGERYYPAQFPYVNDAKRSSDGSTRITDNGTEVDAIADRWYWLDGDNIMFYPAPLEDTQEETSGACTISGSTVTISSGDLGDDNSLKDRLILIGSSYFVIQSHNSSAISVDGTPDDSEVTYTIYEPGLEIWGTRRPTEITINGTAEMPGTDIDVMAIVLRCAYNISVMQGRNAKIDVNGLLNLSNDYRKQAMQSEQNKTFVPKAIVPMVMRSDHAGYMG